MTNADDLDRTAIRKRGTAAFFDRVAGQYDRSGPRFFSYFGQRLVDLAGLPSGAQILDLASGRGAVLFPAAAAVGPQGHISGVDLSERMVIELTQEIQQLGASNITVRQMDVENLQFSDASFDFIFCGFGLFFFPQLERALAEMRRVLRPGGRLAVSLWDRSMDEQWAWFYQEVQAHLPPDPSAKPVPSRPPSGELDTEAGLVRALDAAGFHDIRVTLEAHDFVYTEDNDWWDALWTHWTRMALERIEQVNGAEGLALFKRDIFDRLQAMRQADGIHQLFPALLGVADK
jgi:ubiquinone/menaquinone biosynthesis C-methylase UbiE